MEYKWGEFYVFVYVIFIDNEKCMGRHNYGRVVMFALDKKIASNEQRQKKNVIKKTSTEWSESKKNDKKRQNNFNDYRLTELKVLCQKSG